MTKFEKTASRAIPSLQATVEEYIEPRSGARHIHLASDQQELVFLVGFPTVPDVSDGRAHILEHLSLCGSERYPVRDPFFAMLRRSTATFMNAFTYADRTVYPFASTDRKDFFNLLDVYLDATFFPNLDYLNFLQEGWRHVLKDGKLSYQGVVFNEMKGAFNDPMRALYSGIEGTLLKGTTYEVESGGDPLVIPELTHEMLKQFHASHYHPSQAVFMSAGAIGAEEIQEQIELRVLSKLSAAAQERMLPQLAKAWTAPRVNEVRIPSQQAKPDEYGLQFSWLLGEATDPMAYYNAYLLDSGLLGDASSPLMKAMESAGYGRPSRLNGHDDGPRQLIFHVGMEGLTEPQVEKARVRIWSALERAAKQGVPVESLQAALRDIRYNQRDTSNSHMPNALNRLLQALPLAMRGGDVFDALDSEAHLAKLEVAIQDPQYFKSLVRGLIDSPTRLTTSVVPDAGYFTERDALEAAQLATREAALTDAERARIEAETAALDKHQQLPSNSEVLPRIRPSDVSAHPAPALPLPAPLPAEGAKVLPFTIASNGLSYVRANYDVSGFDAEDWPWLHLYADVVTELGVGDMDYEDADAWRQTMAPSFDVGFEATQKQDGALGLELWFGASGLREEHEGIAELISRTLSETRFDEHERLAFLIDSEAQDRLTGLAQAGNRYAMLAATAPLSPLRRFDDLVGGAASLPFYGKLLEQSKTPQGIAAIAERLSALHRRVVGLTPIVLSAGSGDDSVDLARMVKLPAAQAGTTAASSAVAPALPLADAALHAVSQINHCVVAWRAPMVHEEGAAALAVAAELMTNQLLHAALREKGGAYGGSAGYGGGSGTFVMASYRDPRLSETYADFNVAVDQMLENDFSQEELEEAIICVIKGLDKPNSPHEQVTHAWSLHRRGVSEELRQRFRSGVLNCTLDDIRSAVRTWLKNGQASRAAFVGDLTQDLSGLKAVDLVELANAA